MERKNIRLILGYAMSNLLGVLVEGGIKIIDQYNNHMAFIFITTTFVILPAAMGLICAWYWRDEQLRTGKKILRILLNMLIGFILAFIFLREGVFCLIIVTPLVFAFMFTGFLFGNFMYKKDNNTLNISVLGLLVMVCFIDMISVHHFETSVTDEIIVNAPPAKVWPFVVAYPEIKEKSHYWFFNIGLPKPVGSTVTGYCQGAGRKCIFERNMVFDEIMSVYEPGKNLTFDIIHQPSDPEIMGHINIEKGQFILRDNGNGTTTLVGTSWYSLNVYPAVYFDVWARSITRNVHLRVMEHIKLLCEKAW